MALATRVAQGDMVDYTPASDIAAGDVVVQGDLVGIATRAIAANTLGALAVSGVFDIAKATGASTNIGAGAKVYWNATTSVATASDGSGSNKLIGKAVKAATTTDTTVRVRLSQ